MGKRSAQFIRENRRNRGWTQHELATRLGLSTVTIGRWESGTVPNLLQREKLNKLFGKFDWEGGDG